MTEKTEKKSLNLVFLIASINTGSRSGKNTVAESMLSYIVEFGDLIRPQIIELSYPIKWICENILGLDKEYVVGSKKEELTGVSINGISNNVTGRQIQQFLGTEVFRDNFGDDVWVKRIDRLINAHNDQGRRMGELYSNFSFIPDWRFENEYSYLLNSGHKIITINVDRPSNKTGVTTHRSDNSLVKHADSMDYYLINDGSLKDIQLKSYGVIQDVLEKYGLYTIRGCC